MDKMNNLRSKIDLLDDEIMSLLDKRYQITTEIGTIKKVGNIQVLDTNREKYIMVKAANYSHYPQIKAVYNTIMNESKHAQRK
jgi:chorismate mutase